MRFLQIQLAVAAVMTLLASSTPAAGVRISFLGDDLAFEDTRTFLTSNGCGESSAAAFHQMVRDYFFAGFDIDLSKFPKPQKGFYSFAKMEDLIAALPSEPFRSNHAVGVNCFDTVIVLAQGQLKTSLEPDEVSGPFLVPLLNTNSQPPSFAISGAATPRNAFAQLYGPAYIGVSERFISESMKDSRICLSAALYQSHVLPFSAAGEILRSRTMDVLRLSWRRDRLEFPTRFQLVQIHGVDSAGVCTEHAGLLFRRDKGYSYIEKNGVSGPFVRLDCERQSDLALWLTTLWKECKLHKSHLATFNDADITDVTPPLVK